MTSSTGAFQGKLWKICVVDLQQAGELSPRQSAGRAGAARARLGLAGSRAGRANGPLAWLGQNGQAGAGLWAGKAGWGRLRLGYGQVRQAGAWLWAGKAGWGRLRLGYGQAGARLWAGKAGKAGWGRLWLGPNGQAGAGWGLAIGRLWAGKAGWGRLGQAVARSNGQAGAGWGLAMGRLGLGPNGQGPLAWLGQNGQAGAGLCAGRLGQAEARLWAGKAGWGRLRLGYGQAVARSKWAGWGLGYGQAVARSEWAGWGKLGAESWEDLRYESHEQCIEIDIKVSNNHVGVDLKITRTDALRHVVDQNSTGVDRVMLISKETHQGREQAMGWLTAEYQEQMQAQKVIARERGKGQSDRQAGHTHTQAEGNRATESIKTEGRPTEDCTAVSLEVKGRPACTQTGRGQSDLRVVRRQRNTRRKIEIPTGGAFRGGFAGRAGQGSAQLGFAGLGPRQVGQARLGLAGSRAGRANDLALKNKYKERRGRLGWVLDRLGSWGLTKGRLGMAGLEVGQTGQFKGRFDLQKPDKNETSTNSSCPRTPKMEKKPKKEKPPGIEENPPKGKTPPGKETSVKDGFKGKTPLAGKGNTVNFE
ncbi:hypothetical protein PPACK8108_LOCUS21262 [Phakopsora pachyrhizi]|uniref:Uncharacterized protein n=1 Tax=Phakopsora pachyrhizi TaxID=170000 RepID=A0AAV0BJ60_PHAPC|nr:hypothetical protein PPACK8108_LOCUS21262 [Phakopsora pachyrhizi]